MKWTIDDVNGLYPEHDKTSCDDVNVLNVNACRRCNSVLLVQRDALKEALEKCHAMSRECGARDKGTLMDWIRKVTEPALAPFRSKP